MLRPIDTWFLSHPEPIQSTLQFLRTHILQNVQFTESWKYGMPFYCINNKMTCYLWVHKKYNQPYLGIVEGHQIADPDLLQEKRARMKILLIDPQKDIPLKQINAILKQVIALYR